MRKIRPLSALAPLKIISYLLPIRYKLCGVSMTVTQKGYPSVKFSLLILRNCPVLGNSIHYMYLHTFGCCPSGSILTVADPLASLPGALSATAHGCLGSLLAAYWRFVDSRSRDGETGKRGNGTCCGASRAYTVHKLTSSAPVHVVVLVMQLSHLCMCCAMCCL